MAKGDAQYTPGTWQNSISNIGNAMGQGAQSIMAPYQNAPTTQSNPNQMNPQLMDLFQRYFEGMKARNAAGQGNNNG